MRNSYVVKRQENNKKRPKDLGKLIVIGGPGGSGASTIAREIARYYGLNYFYSGLMMRSLARRQNAKSLESFMRSAYFTRNRNKIDKFIDRETIKFSQLADVLIDSKTFAGLSHKKGIPCTVKIWLTADLCTRIHRHLYSHKRIKKNTKLSKNSKLYMQTRSSLVLRYSNDKKRYYKLYGIDYDKQELYNDIVIDTSKMGVGATVNLINKLLKDGKFIR